MTSEPWTDDDDDDDDDDVAAADNNDDDDAADGGGGGRDGQPKPIPIWGQALRTRARRRERSERPREIIKNQF